MAWVKKTDGAPWSKKIGLLSDGAYRLYDQGLHYSAKEEMDGVILLSLIPHVIAGIKTKRIKEAIAELTKANLWHESGDSCASKFCPASFRPTCEGTWDIHDYFEHNKTHSQLEAEREAERIRKRIPPRNPGGIRPEATPEGGGIPVASRARVLARPVPLASLAPLPPDPHTKELGRRILTWWADQKGWDQGMPDVAKQQTIAFAFAAMPLEEDVLFSVLNELWMRAKKKPESLNYFSAALEEAVSANKVELSGSRGFAEVGRL